MKSYSALLLVGVVLAFCSGVYAATIHVPAGRPTIPNSINTPKASSGAQSLFFDKAVNYWADPEASWRNE